MLGQLNENQIEEFMHRQVIGHLACCNDNNSYVVPISYAYDGTYVFCHAHEGKKLDMMRKNPLVCFEVDEYTDMSNWKSVIAWGRFEELNNGTERNEALKILLNRAIPVQSSSTMHLGSNWPFSPNDTRDIPGIVFRIRLEEKTGRFERSDQSPPLAG